MDLVSRIAIGAFSDTHILKPTQIVAISQVVMGKVAVVVPHEIFTTVQ